MKPKNTTTLFKDIAKPRYLQKHLKDYDLPTNQNARQKTNDFIFHNALQQNQQLFITRIHGSTWDCQHLDHFIKGKFGNQGNCYDSTIKTFQKTAKSLHNYTGQNFYFKNIDRENDRNTSKIGFNKINPLVHNYSTKPQSIDKFQRQYFNNRNGSQKIRLKHLISNRYPHGILGIDNPDSCFKFYKKLDKQLKRRKFNEQSNEKQTFIISKLWKSKGTVQKQQSKQLTKNIRNKKQIQKRKQEYNIINCTSSRQ